jgi:hypothetical protein
MSPYRILRAFSLDFPWLGKYCILYLPSLYIYFGFTLARLKWSSLLKSVRLPLQDVDSPKVVDLPLLPPLVPQQHRMCLGCIRTGPCDTMAPSTVTWMAIYGRLGTGRLGTVILSISFVI